MCVCVVVVHTAARRWPVSWACVFGVGRLEVELCLATKGCPAVPVHPSPSRKKGPLQPCTAKRPDKQPTRFRPTRALQLLGVCGLCSAAPGSRPTRCSWLQAPLNF